MGSFISGISSPAKMLMAQFRYSIKFTIISVIFIVPLIISLAFLQYEFGDEIRFTRKELQGIESLRLVGQEQKALAEAVISDRTQFDPKVKSGNPQFTQLESDVVNRKLSDYQSSLQDGDLEASFSQLLTLGQSVADYSNLELDLALDTSYLITTLVQTLPQTQAQLLMTASIARQVAENGSFTPDTYISLSNANQKLPLMISNTQDSIDVSLAANADIRGQLGSQWQQLYSELNSYHQWVQSQILDPDDILVSATEVVRKSTELNQSITEFSQRVLPVLSEQLENRISEARFKNNIVLTVSVLAVALALLLFIGMYLSVTENIRAVVSAVHSVAEGNLSTRVTVDGRDEMREIADDMNGMTANLEHLVERLSDAITSLSSSAGELKVVTEQTISGVQEQKNGTELIAQSMHELTEVAGSVDQNSEVASESAVEADSEAQQGIKLVEQLQNVMQEMQNESSRSQEALNRLVNDSKDIGQVSSAINEIAEQTNLLALNAAIEAARAGEQGRGFAVVADEVRTLAQRTQEQTNQIHDIISKLQQATQDTRVSMEQSREQMNLSVQEAAVVGDALHRISQVISTINARSTEISDSASQQSEVTHQVAQQVKHIASISEQTREGAEETDRSADGLMRVVETLKSELAMLQKGH